MGGRVVPSRRDVALVAGGGRPFEGGKRRRSRYRRPVSVAERLLDLLRAERFAEIREMFAPNLRPLVTPETLRAAWDAERGRHGALASFGTPSSDPTGPGGALIRVPVTFEHGAATLVVTVGEGDWLTGLQVAAPSAAEPVRAWEPPPYAGSQPPVEREVTVGSGALAVPGTVTLPAAGRPRGAVVLLAGSGPLDRDETIGRNKPFKDLAWGLAAAGVATLRFDKVTYAHPAGVARLETFTVDDEYVHHAVAAVELLREADPRVFVLGHSLGGTVAPRVAAADPSVAGLILLAAGAQPLHWSAVRQFRHLGAAPEVVAAVTAQARAVDSPDLSAATPSSSLPFGIPAAYWLDLRGYDPAAAAAALGKPILILQGGRDYQVTVADDLALWKAALHARHGVTVRVHDADNHLFFPGAGRSAPAEYEAAQHVDPAVVADVAGWITAGRSENRRVG